MSRIAIVTDSISAMPDDLQREYGIHILPLHVNFGTEEYLDGVDIRTDEFFHRMQQAKELPTTAAPSVGEYLELYSRLAEGEAEAIVCVTCASPLSMTYTSARAASQAMEGIDIRVVDSRTGLMAQGFVALEAARAAQAGATINEVMERAQAMIPKVRLFITLDTLENMRRGGRIGGAQALLGSVLQIKPLIHVPTEKGRVEPLGASLTRTRALHDLVNHMARAVEGRPVHVAVHQGACRPDEVEILVGEIRRRFDCRELHQAGITAAIGTHTGPGTLAVAFWTD